MAPEIFPNQKPIGGDLKAPMTLQECINKEAISARWRSGAFFMDYVSEHLPEEEKNIFLKAAELYAKSKVDECIETLHKWNRVDGKPFDLNMHNGLVTVERSLDQSKEKQYKTLEGNTPRIEQGSIDYESDCVCTDRCMNIVNAKCHIRKPLKQ